MATASGLIEWLRALVNLDVLHAGFMLLVTNAAHRRCKVIALVGPWTLIKCIVMFCHMLVTTYSALHAPSEAFTG